MRQRITSRQNDHIKRILRLMSSAQARREAGVFVLEGVRLCMDAVHSGISRQLVCVSDSAAGREELAALEEGAEYCLQIPDSLFVQIADTKSPQGILCIAKTPVLWQSRPCLQENGRYLALEQVSDPGNLGTIARTAEALGADGLILSGGCDPFSPKAQRAAMGALLRIPLFHADEFPAFLREQRLPSFAAVPNTSAIPVETIDFSGGGIVCIGNEGNGLTAEAISASTHWVTIPMAGRAESLNAAAAAAILCYLLTREVPR